MNHDVAQHWNRILVRFLLAFAFWEVLAFPIRMLLFSKFYYAVDTKPLFVTMAEVNWIGPVAGDFIQALGVGILYGFSRFALPYGLLGGFVFGGAYALASSLGIALVFVNLTNIAHNQIWWVWVGYQALFAFAVSIVYSAGWEED